MGPRGVSGSRWAVTFTDPGGDALCEITFGVYSPDNSVNADPAGFAALLNAAVAAHFPAASTNDVSWTGSIYENVDVVPYGGGSFPMTPVSGTISTGTTAMPNANAIAVKRISADAGRWGRGRVFWPLWANNQMSAENTVAASYTNAIKTALAAFQTALTDPSTFLSRVGHWSKQHGKVPLDPMVFHETVTWAIADSTPDTQRRRGVGRGK